MLHLLKNKEELINVLKSGEIICLPTDTAFGFIADATNNMAINKIYTIKNRVKNKGLPILFDSIGHIENHATLNNVEKLLSKEFWPGGLTIILNKTPNATNATNTTNAKNTASIKETINEKIPARIPNNDLILWLINKLKKPLIGTSANISTMPNITCYEELVHQFQNNNINNNINNNNAKTNAIAHSVYGYSNYANIKLNAVIPSTIVSVDNKNKIIIIHRIGIISPAIIEKHLLSHNINYTFIL